MAKNEQAEHALPPDAERRKKQYPRAMKKCPARHMLIEPTSVERDGTKWYEYRAVQRDGTLGRACDFMDLMDLVTPMPVKVRNVDHDWWWVPEAIFLAACDRRGAKT